MSETYERHKDTCDCDSCRDIGAINIDGLFGKKRKRKGSVNIERRSEMSMKYAYSARLAAVDKLLLDIADRDIENTTAEFILAQGQFRAALVKEKARMDKEVNATVARDAARNLLWVEEKVI